MTQTTEILNKTLTVLCRKLEVSEEDLLGGCRRRELTDARCLMAAWMKGLPGVKQEDVARMLGKTQAGVSKMLVRHEDLMKVDAEYRNKWLKVKG